MASQLSPASPQPQEQETGWLVYLLECADGTLYCGITTNMPRRLAQHNGQSAGGARYTRGRRPVQLCASLPCTSRSLALRLEAHIKALPSPAAKRAFFTRVIERNTACCPLKP
ncbi:MAG: GIY-YIG nuclease family protein [Desulfovibrionaceae bacterium]|nr:GIY-YIG nuclease family protein [Desulfovibrionaceae bacterium]